MKKSGNMTIKKNGRIFRLTETDLQRIVKKLIREQSSPEADWDVATKFCADVVKWWDWENDSQDHANFFKPFQSKSWTQSDNDKDAALAYEHYIMNKLNNEVGENNEHYDDIKGWIDKIVDEIDDWFQNPENCRLTIYGPQGKNATYEVDPEIDV